MGWFLFEKKKSKRRKSKSRAASKKSVPSRWDRRRLYALVRFFGCVAVIGGLGYAWYWGQGRLQVVVGAEQSAELKVVLLDAPAWMPEQVLGELRTIVARPLRDADVFDHDALHEASRRLGASPWIERVQRIVRRADNRVDVMAQYRQRAALIGTSSGFHLIDRASVRLPFTYERSQAFETGLPVIVGVTAPAPAAGTVWKGGDVEAGLKVARVIATRPWNGQVRAVDVSNYNGRLDGNAGHIKIVTAMNNGSDPADNAGIEWGRAPGEEQFFEPTTAWKLQRVDMEVRKYGRLDDRIVVVTSEPGLTRRITGDEAVTTRNADSATIPVGRTQP